MTPRGGLRQGAGRKLGTLNSIKKSSTLEKSVLLRLQKKEHSEIIECSNLTDETVSEFIRLACKLRCRLIKRRQEKI